MGSGTSIARDRHEMPLTIWQHASRRCTVSITGFSIAVQLRDGENLVEERAVSSTDQALTLAELWRSNPPGGSQLSRRVPRNLPPLAAARRRRDSAAVPRVMWIDRR
jgi:hypothetical protein